MSKKIITIFAILASTMAFSQVGIGTTTPSSKSILDLTATDKGLLLPRMTTAQRTAIAPTATTDKSMQVFDTTTNTIWFWNGTLWVEQGAKNIYDNNGDISPTAAVSRAVTFTNGGSLNFDTNTLFVDATNNRVGIGTNAPLAQFNVSNSLRVGATSGLGYIDFGTCGSSSGYAAFHNSVEQTGYIGCGNGMSYTALNGNHHTFNGGNVGIYTESPTQALDVNGNARFRSVPTDIQSKDAVTIDAQGNLSKNPNGSSNFTIECENCGNQTFLNGKSIYASGNTKTGFPIYVSAANTLCGTDSEKSFMIQYYKGNFYYNPSRDVLDDYAPYVSQLDIIGSGTNTITITHVTGCGNTMTITLTIDGATGLIKVSNVGGGYQRYRFSWIN